VPWRIWSALSIAPTAGRSSQAVTFR